MARACTVCGKGTVHGNAVSHSMKATRRRWLPNLQKIRIMVNGTPKQAYVCTKCLKAGKVTRAI